MTSRFSTVAIIGAVLALASTTLLVLFRLYDDGVPVQLMRTLKFYEIDVIPFIGVGHLVAIVLAAFAVVRPPTVARTLLAVGASIFALAASLTVYLALYTLFWSRIVFLCIPASACNPNPSESALKDSLILLGLFVVAGALIAISNRKAPAGDTAIRIGLLLLSALPFLAVLGLAGTLVLTRRDTATATEAERELVDA